MYDKHNIGFTTIQQMAAHVFMLRQVLHIDDRDAINNHVVTGTLFFAGELLGGQTGPVGAR